MFARRRTRTRRSPPQKGHSAPEIENPSTSSTHAVSKVTFALHRKKPVRSELLARIAGLVTDRTRPRHCLLRELVRQRFEADLAVRVRFAGELRECRGRSS